MGQTTSAMDQSSITVCIVDERGGDRILLEERVEGLVRWSCEEDWVVNGRFNCVVVEEATLRRGESFGDGESNPSRSMFSCAEV